MKEAETLCPKCCERLYVSYCMDSGAFYVYCPKCDRLTYYKPAKKGER